MKLPKVEFVDDGPGKPVGINRFIGRRPIFAFGNSDGDLQMLQWTAAGDGRALRAASSITPMPRANTPTTGSRKIGKLDKAWDEAMRARLDRRRHEAGLEDGVRVRTRQHGSVAVAREATDASKKKKTMEA